MKQACSEVKHYDKVFGNCKVCWKIENFCLATCKENYTIQSSEFCVSGPTSTTWKLLFIPKPQNTSFMLLYLKRLSDPGPINVSVNWSVIIGSLNGDCYYCENKHDFEKMMRKRTELSSLSDMMLRFKPFDCDTLIIQCHLIVQHPGRTVKLNKPDTLGLRCLAEDLGSMCVSNKNKDLVLQVGEKKISVHKAVMSSNAFLQKLIHNADNNTVVLPGLNSAAVTKYIHFLYTGYLDKILQNPSLSIYKCLEVMDRDLLQSYFALEELKLHTLIKVEEFEHLWIIQDFSKRKEKKLTSPRLKKANLDTTWQLRLFLPRISNIDYLSIYADIVEGHKPSNACLEFGVQDSEGEIYHPRKILSTNGNYDMEIKDFIYDACLYRTSLVVNDTLNLVFRVRTWNGEDYSLNGSRMICFMTEKEESLYRRLSKNMLNLYRSGINSDILIQTASTTFRAHKCIVSARSPLLSSMIEELRGENNLTLNNIDPYVLNLLLEYIYSGFLLEHGNNILLMLYNAAKEFRISSLEDECQQALPNSVENLADHI